MSVVTSSGCFDEGEASLGENVEADVAAMKRPAAAGAL
jgi:hypothetical protein